MPDLLRFRDASSSSSNMPPPLREGNVMMKVGQMPSSPAVAQLLILMVRDVGGGELSILQWSDRKPSEASIKGKVLLRFTRRHGGFIRCADLWKTCHTLLDADRTPNTAHGPAKQPCAEAWLRLQCRYHRI